MDLYSEKHYERSERNLKKAYFVDYLRSQMTLLEQEESKVRLASEQETNETDGLIKSKKLGKRSRKSSESTHNLFSDGNKRAKTTVI